MAYQAHHTSLDGAINCIIEVENAYHLYQYHTFSWQSYLVVELELVVHTSRIGIRDKDASISQSSYTTPFMMSIDHGHEIAIRLQSPSMEIMLYTFFGHILQVQVWVTICLHRAMLGALILA